MRPASTFFIIQLLNSRLCLRVHTAQDHGGGKGRKSRKFLIESGVSVKKTLRIVHNFSVALWRRIQYDPVFDSCWKQKSLYPLYLLGYSDFFHCFEL